ncbi:Heparan-sulfate 6-O-sulfotransferase 2 [Camelus dromedarius]|uniref:Heparan-sulfate 6-O-sulfotransferase n=1 Tax=Camelus dromedarius TaxID=9838 RepID=A0A5N4C420_CAMDR|nr:Heparan-sulfate 6-O-sulfotransferase 2 [Camelus dromedarius]
MDEKSNKLLLALVMLFLFAVIVLQYVCPGTECPAPPPAGVQLPCQTRTARRMRAPPGSCPFTISLSRGDLLRKVDFDIKGDDLIVFLHIQKTGGTTFGRHLVRNIHWSTVLPVSSTSPNRVRPFFSVGQKKCTCHRRGSGRPGLPLLSPVPLTGL